MANPQSLPFSSSHSTVHAKPTQLPFAPSTSPSVVSRFQLPPSPIHPQTFGKVPARPHNRSESVVSKHSRTQRSGINVVDPLTSSGSTHAAGIQPSAAFFHPSRPNARPPSVVSVSSTQEISESLHIVPEHSPDSDAEDESLGRQLSTSTKFSARQRQSREPLLPIGGPVRRPTVPSQTTTPTRPSFSHQNASPTGNMPSTPSRMRNSLDKMFRKRFSVDSAMKSMQSLGRINTLDSYPQDESPMTDERMIFELKPTDQGRVSPQPFHGHKTLSPPVFARDQDQHYSFIPTPPPNSADVSQVPITDSKGRPVHNYSLNRSRNRFFCGGRLLTGGDSPWAFIASLIVAFGITGVYFGTTCVWWWKNESPAVAAVGAYMALLTISSMMTTAFSDPGILPRDLDTEPPYPNHSPSDGTVRTPLPRDLKVRAGVVRVKYCFTCKTYRPPRSSHCKMCDNCVDGCDHHCQWVNNCVGRRNYTAFFVFLFSAVLTLILIIVTSAFHLYLITIKEHVNFQRALSRGVGSAIAFALSVIIVWPVTALLVYHLRLLVLNATTIEQIRNQAHKALVSGPAPPNPFSHGSWKRNLAYVLCRPVGYSWLDSAGIATEDKRAINPGMEKYKEEKQ